METSERSTATLPGLTMVLASLVLVFTGCGDIGGDSTAVESAADDTTASADDESSDPATDTTGAEEPEPTSTTVDTTTETAEEGPVSTPPDLSPEMLTIGLTTGMMGVELTEAQTECIREEVIPAAPLVDGEELSYTMAALAFCAPDSLVAMSTAAVPADKQEVATCAIGKLFGRFDGLSFPEILEEMKDESDPTPEEEAELDAIAVSCGTTSEELEAIFDG